MTSNYKKIISRFDKLARNDKEEAKRYFSDIIFSSSLTFKFTDKQFIDLFIHVYYNLPNEIEYFFSIMNKNSFIDKHSISSQKKLFLLLLNEEAKKGLIFGEEFTKLLKAYSKQPTMIDNNYVNNILMLSKRLDYDAIFYILNSPYIYKLDRKLIDLCLKNLCLHQKTMDKEVLELINNKELIKILDEAEIKQLIERVSKNIGNEKSLKFVFKVISNKNISNKYLKNEKLFNFEYLNDNKLENITKILIKVGFYDKYFYVNDKSKLKKVILKMMEYDPLFLSYFKMGCINDNTIDIDLNVLYGIIKSNYQHMLIDVSNYNPMGKNLSLIFNYLHNDNMYCNQLISIIFKNIVTFPLKKNMINTCNEQNIDAYTHYLINNIDFNLNSINEYEFVIMENLNYAYESYSSINYFKDCLCMNRYGFSYKKIYELYFEYGETIDLMDEVSVKRIFKEFKDIIFNRDKRCLYGKYMTNIFSFDESNRYEQKLKELYNEILINNIFSIKDLKYNYKIKIGNDFVDVMKITDKFEGLVSSLGFAREVSIINDSYKDALLYNKNVFNHGLSVSYYSSENLFRAPGNIVFGYCDLAKQSIQLMSNSDIYSNGDDYSISKTGETRYIHRNELASYTRNGYNELVIERKNLNVNDPDYYKNILPNYILVDEDDINLHTIYRISKELDIPIIIIDRRLIIDNNKKELLAKLKDFTPTSLKDYRQTLALIFNLSNLLANEDYFYDFANKITDEFIEKNRDNYEMLIGGEDILYREINKDNVIEVEAYRLLSKIRMAANRFIKQSKIDSFFMLNDYEVNKVSNAALMIARYGILSSKEDGFYYTESISIALIALSLSKIMHKEINENDLIYSSLFIGGNVCDLEYGFNHKRCLYTHIHDAKYPLMLEFSMYYENLFDISNVKSICESFIDADSLLDIYNKKDKISVESMLISYAYLIYDGKEIEKISKLENINTEYLKQLHNIVNDLFINRIK